MNKELKQEAEESADKWIKWAIDYKSLTYWNSYVEGYLACSKSREMCIRKAKDLIRRLITIYCDQIEYDEFGNTLEEARAFIKDKSEKQLTTMQDETVIIMTNKLIKARKVIKDLMSEFARMDIKPNWRFCKEAEQFLNSEVEK